jgi:ribonuclease HI
MIKGKRFTVINTDAGIKGNVSAWGFWIRSEDVRVIKCNKFKIHIETDSDKAELSAIINALVYVCKNEYLRTADVFVVNTDSKNAVNAFTNNNLSKYPELEEAFIKIKEVIKTPIWFKWVKGHSNGDSPRKWVNNYIDRMIRKQYK